MTFYLLKLENADIVKSYNNYYRLVLWMNLIGYLFLYSSCHSLSSKESHTSAKALFNEAEQLKKRGYYNEAVSQLRKLKNRWLYSRFFKEADLAIADIYFLKKEWNKATAAYTMFSKMYRNHPQADRVFFRLALSVFHQLPSIPDRDLQLAKKALEHFNRHLKLFPKSLYRKQSLQYKKDILSQLARKQWMIAKFHISAGRNRSALPYLKTLIHDFANDLPSDIPSMKDLKQKISTFQVLSKKKELN